MSNYYFNKVIRKLDIKLHRRMPIIHQSELSECGLACLGMICGYYGKNIDILSLRQQFNMSSRGITLVTLTDIAEKLGLSSRALSLELDELSDLILPCILHWEFNHFVVLLSIKRNRVVLHDPAIGQRIVTFSELTKSFTGIAFEVWPGSEFTTNRVKNKIGLRKLINSIYGIKSTLGKLFCLSLIVEIINLLMPIGTQLVMDHAIPANDMSLLSITCLGLFFFILLRAIVSISRAWSSLVMASIINVQWHSSLFDHLLKLPVFYFDKRSLGEIQSRFSSLDVLRETFTSSIVGALMDGIMIICVLVMMVLYGGVLAYVVIAFTAIYILIRLLTYNYYRQLSEESLIKDARSNSYFMETLFGISTIKMQNMIKRRRENWINLEIDCINTNIRISKIEMLFGGLNTLITACDQIFILFLGVSLVIKNEMTIGMFVAFSSFRGQFSERASSLTEFCLRLRMMSLHNERVADIALHAREEYKPEIVYEAKLVPLPISVRGLTYRYDNQSPAIFSNICLHVKSGESVAIIGPSGVGKTTLLKVMCGLFVPNEGTIEVNGLDIRNIGINNYRKMIACVMQDDKIFSGSIRDNICGFTDDVDEKWMDNCAKLSHINDFINGLPLKYETLIGELGEGLSGGQKQRLLIARAIYKKPGILFLDEATSALDKDSENAVNDAIKKLNITRVIIAHRESTIQSADRVIDILNLQ